MVKVESNDGVEQEVDCIGCALQKGELVGEDIAETENFSVQQDYETPIPGFMIISSKKHIKGIEDLSEDGRKEFIELLYKVRKAMTDALDVEYVYIIQKEDTFIARAHFHVWLFPVYDWMGEFGRKMESVTHIIEHARNNMKDDETLSKVKEASVKIKEILAK